MRGATTCREEAVPVALCGTFGTSIAAAVKPLPPSPLLHLPPAACLRAQAHLAVLAYLQMVPFWCRTLPAAL